MNCDYCKSELVYDKVNNPTTWQSNKKCEACNISYNFYYGATEFYMISFLVDYEGAQYFFGYSPLRNKLTIYRYAEDIPKDFYKSSIPPDLSPTTAVAFLQRILKMKLFL